MDQNWCRVQQQHPGWYGQPSLVDRKARYGVALAAARKQRPNFERSAGGCPGLGYSFGRKLQWRGLWQQGLAGPPCPLYLQDPEVGPASMCWGELGRPTSVDCVIWLCSVSGYERHELGPRKDHALTGNFRNKEGPSHAFPHGHGKAVRNWLQSWMATRTKEGCKGESSLTWTTGLLRSSSRHEARRKIRR